MPSRSVLARIAATMFAVLWIAAAAEAQYPKRETIQAGLIDPTFFPQPVLVAKVLQTAGAGARHHLLLEGKIDVGLQSIPWAYVAEDAGFNNLGAAADYVPKWQFTTHNVNGEWAKANPAKVEDFLRAILRSTDWIYRNRAQSAEIAARELSIKIS